jgi:hypothetical protein
MPNTGPGDWKLLSATIESKEARTIYADLHSSVFEERAGSVLVIFDKLSAVDPADLIDTSAEGDGDGVVATTAGYAPTPITAVFYASAFDATVLLALKELLFHDRTGTFLPWEPYNEKLYLYYAEAIYSRLYIALAYCNPAQFATTGKLCFSLFNAAEPAGTGIDCLIFVDLRIATMPSDKLTLTDKVLAK